MQTSKGISISINTAMLADDRIFFDASDECLGEVLCNGHWILFGINRTYNTNYRKLVERAHSKTGALGVTKWKSIDGKSLESDDQLPDFLQVIPESRTFAFLDESFETSGDSLETLKLKIDQSRCPYTVDVDGCLSYDTSAEHTLDSDFRVGVGAGYYLALRKLGLKLAIALDGGDYSSPDLNPLIVIDGDQVVGLLMPCRL